jgi:hypothetical protein
MNTFSLRTITLLLCFASAAGAAFAQTTRSTPGEGNYPPSAAGANTRPPAPAQPPATSRWHTGPRHTPGWTMMSEQERAQHHARLQAAQSPEECQRILEEHRGQMEQRATERRMPMRRPSRAACPMR